MGEESAPYSRTGVWSEGTPPPDSGWGVPIEEWMRVELLGASCSRLLNRAGRPWSVREDGIALEESQLWRGRKHCLLQQGKTTLGRGVR